MRVMHLVFAVVLALQLVHVVIGTPSRSAYTREELEDNRSKCLHSSSPLHQWPPVAMALAVDPALPGFVRQYTADRPVPAGLAALSPRAPSATVPSAGMTMDLLISVTLPMDAALLPALFESIGRYWTPHVSGQVVLVCVNCGGDVLPQNATAGLGTPHVPCNVRMEFVDTPDCLNGYVGHNWASFEADRFATTEYIALADSDMILHAPVTMSDLFHTGLVGQPKPILLGRSFGAQRWDFASRELLGLTSKLDFMDYLPFVAKTSTLSALRSHVINRATSHRPAVKTVHAVSKHGSRARHGRATSATGASPELKRAVYGSLIVAASAVSTSRRGKEVWDARDDNMMKATISIDTTATLLLDNKLLPQRNAWDSRWCALFGDQTELNFNQVPCNFCLLATYAHAYEATDYSVVVEGHNVPVLRVGSHKEVDLVPRTCSRTSIREVAAWDNYTLADLSTPLQQLGKIIEVADKRMPGLDAAACFTSPPTTTTPPRSEGGPEVPTCWQRRCKEVFWPLLAWEEQVCWVRETFDADGTGFNKFFHNYAAKLHQGDAWSRCETDSVVRKIDRSFMSSAFSRGRVSLIESRGAAHRQSSEEQSMRAALAVLERRNSLLEQQGGTDCACKDLLTLKHLMFIALDRTTLDVAMLMTKGHILGADPKLLALLATIRKG